MREGKTARICKGGFMNLSKSRYCKGVQCQKILWLDKNKSELRDDSVLNETVLNMGNKVGALARYYFGEYAEVPYNEDKNIMIAETRRLLDMRTGISDACPRTICEA